jgi:hypothetical protein
LNESSATVLEDAVHTRAARLLALVATATASATLVGCGTLQVTTGPVPGSKAGPHLSQAQFVQVTERALSKAWQVHVTATGTKGGRTSSLVADASFEHGAAVDATMTDGLGLYGAPSTTKRQLLLVGNRVFVAVPHRTGSFVAVDVAGPRSRYGRLSSATRRAVRPTQGLEPVRRGLRSLTYDGMEAGQGLYLDHYELGVDTARAFGAAAVRKLHAPATTTIQVWLDSDNLLRRMSYELGGVHLDTVYSAWGHDVDVESPGAKHVVRTVRG